MLFMFQMSFLRNEYIFTVVKIDNILLFLQTLYYSMLQRRSEKTE